MTFMTPQEVRAGQTKAAAKRQEQLKSKFDEPLRLNINRALEEEANAPIPSKNVESSVMLQDKADNELAREYKDSKFWEELQKELTTAGWQAKISIKEAFDVQRDGWQQGYLSLSLTSSKLNKA